MVFNSSTARTAFLACALIFTLASVAQAQPWVSFDSHSRYVALGDSISAGYGAMPTTQGFTYNLYQSGIIDNHSNTLFCPMAISGAVTKDVLDYQLPQLKRFLHYTGKPYRQVITLTTGGNDLFTILEGAEASAVLGGIAANLTQILTAIKTEWPNARIYVSNFYDPKLSLPGLDVRSLILYANQLIAGVVAAFPDSAVLVDVFTPFEGRSGLLIIEKKGSAMVEAHPTNAGHRVIADAFAGAIRQH